MSQTIGTVKVNNEIELCEVANPECKKEIERALLKNRISYYIRWPKSTLLGRKKEHCIICINDNYREEAEEVVRLICEEHGYRVRFIMKKTSQETKL